VAHLGGSALPQIAVCGCAALLLVITARSQLSRVTAHR
jgi:hypothetical protein